MYEKVKPSRHVHATPAAIVCLVFTEKTLYHRDQDLDARGSQSLATALKRPDIKGECGEFTPVHSADGEPLALLGLGKRNEFSRAKLTAAAAGLVKGLHRLEAREVNIAVSAEVLETFSSHASPGADGAIEFGLALGEGLGLGNFRFRDFKKKSDEDAGLKELSVFLIGDEHELALAAGLSGGLELAESANIARKLSATPPNVATTTYVANEALKIARAAKNLKCNILRGPALLKHNFVGLDNVGKASEHPPCMIELIYTPEKKSSKTLLLIGKTICYDTGGLSIKPREGMRGMKYDKCGGMAVLGAMHAVSRLQPDFRVVGLLPTAENSISHNALRVDDILRYPNGVSVEVTNTDAEGRLVLADALIYGVKQFKPSAVIDLATLTGGVVVGLGRTYAGYWCEDEKLRAQLERAAADSGDKIWRLPMHDDYKEMMKAKHADIWNSAPMREAHPIQGAAFLSSFIDAKIPWAHIDIAGTADIERDKAPFCAGPTGFGVRLLTRLVEEWMKK